MLTYPKQSTVTVNVVRLQAVRERSAWFVRRDARKRRHKQRRAAMAAEMGLEEGDEEVAELESVMSDEALADEEDQEGIHTAVDEALEDLFVAADDYQVTRCASVRE